MEKKDLTHMRAMLDSSYIYSIISKLKIPSNGYFLDIGCGSGIASQIAAQCHPNIHIEGLDISSEAIERANAMVKDQRIHFRLEDATALPYADNSIDCCFSRMLISISPTASKIIKECCRVVKTKGFVVFYDNLRSTATGAINPVHALDLISAYKRYRRLVGKRSYDMSQIIDELKRLGMSVWVERIVKDTNAPGREALIKYYCTSLESLEQNSKENTLVDLHLITPQIVKEYEEDLQRLLKQTDVYLSFEQVVIYAQKMEDKNNV